ncbi:WASH complex subunit 2C [Plutella xylostella]|uniref:WASH complex subunit 2C n=1 Tax=Plutella xylostella TaxID=51655 RepID=UPI002032CBAB|nr:WASH complex subunit 2C [Plutella xylostella]
MESGASAEALRRAAPAWSLAADRQLLDLLQHIHQKIVTRCETTNSKLEGMAAALTSAARALHNVNNRFMALSDTQFIESRVYDDDTDVAADAESKPPPAPLAPPPLAASLRCVERLHSPVTILDDSDSDSDAEDTTSIILRPKNRYSSRPLPFIIGSAPWRSKEHAGLLADSDSDSCSSVPSPGEFSTHEDEDRSPRASDSSSLAEPPPAPPIPPGAPGAPAAPAAPRLTQADLAAQLARKLGGVPQVQQSTVEDASPPPATGKLYTIEKPTAGVIFSDVPPPIDNAQDTDEDVYSEEEDDIFAEINKKVPYAAQNRAQNSADIFAGLGKGFGESTPYGVKDKVDVGGRGDVLQSQRPAVQKTTLFEDEEDSDLFTEKPKPKEPIKTTQEEEKSQIKKPIGAISLFGSSRGAESIGAAILNRNRRKTSSSSEESNQEGATDNANTKKHKVAEREGANAKKEVLVQENTKTVKVRDEEPVARSKENDIFDDLFAKSEKSQKQNVKPQIKQEVKKEIPKKVDLFSDDIFDDIDDIFSSNIVVKKTPGEVKSDKNKSESLFDDVDDLFSEVSVEKVNASMFKNDTKDTKRIFDSDDDLFSDKSGNKENSLTTENNTKTISKELGKDDDISLSKPIPKTENREKTVNITQNTNKMQSKNPSQSIFDSDDELFSPKPKQPTNYGEVKEKKSIKPSIFDDDEGDDIFSSIKPPSNVIKQGKAIDNEESNESNKNKDAIFNKSVVVEPLKINDVKKPENNEGVKKTSTLFGDDDDDGLFAEVKEKKDIIPDSLIKNKQLNEKSKNDDILNKSELKPSLNDEKTIKTLESSQNNEEVKVENSEEVMQTSSIFGDDDDDLFSERSDKTDFKVSTKTKEEIPKSNSLRPNQDQDTVSELSEKGSLSSSTENHQTIDELSNNYKQIKSMSDNDNDNSNSNISSRRVDDKISNIETDVTTKNKTIESKITNNTIDEPQITYKLDDNGTFPQEKTKLLDSVDVLDNKLSNLDDNKNFETDTLFKTPEGPKPLESKHDIFDDIFSDLPPEFEKPKEKKKSQNVNALFDDDSDDEALFLRKTEADNLTDELPEISPITNKEPLFGIFQDEPPEIDTDFTPKHVKTTKPIEKLSNVVKQNIPVTADNPDGSKQTKPDDKPKAIGKLKPLNFNINVNSLLPGASPKKVVIKTKDSEASTPSSPESPKEFVEPKSKLVKSVSFDSDPDSLVLDNKISKERAKIQVKRRPSTRRARREAVKTSGIDFGDVLDGKDAESDVNVNLNKEVTGDGKKAGTFSNEGHHKPDKPLQVPSDPELVETKDEKVEVSKDNAQKSDVSKNTTGFIEETAQNKDTVTKDKVTETLDVNNSKTKILNINDDDIYIFNYPDVSAEENNTTNKNNEGVKTLGQVYTESSTNNVEHKVEESKPKQLNIVDDDDDNDDIFKGFPTNKQAEEKKVQKDNEIKSKEKTPQRETKKSLFDDLSDDEDLFGGNKTINKSTESKNLFSNDSDDDLFAQKPFAKREVRKPVEVKKSLFDDDDDEGDLFGAQPKTSVKTNDKTRETKSSAKERESTASASTAVFVDPLSMFGEEEDF